MAQIDIPIEYRRLFDGDWREAAIYGGRYSLKSHTVARYLLIMARMQKTRVACFREFQNSISESSHQLLSDLIKLYGLNEFKVTDKSIINEINGSDFLFKGLHHNEQSIKSIEGIDIAWVEEAQTISKSSLDVLTPTIRKPGSKIIYTYNRLMEDDPVHVRLVLEGRPNALIIKANYDIAEKYHWLPDVIKAEIEDDKTNRPSLYRHKWLGEPNTLERKIYKGWRTIDEIPFGARLWRRGMDFGYTNDPTVLVDIYEYDCGYIIDETIYSTGLSNKMIYDKVQVLPEPKTLIIADSSDPKSIDELSLYGLNIVGAKKGPGSVYQGIQFVQGLKISVTARSVRTWKAYLNYLFIEDNSGKILNDPDDSVHEWSNSMDSIRYGFNGVITGQNNAEIERSILANLQTQGNPIYVR